MRDKVGPFQARMGLRREVHRVNGKVVFAPAEGGGTLDFTGKDESTSPS